MAHLGLLRRNKDFRRAFLAEVLNLGGSWFVVVPLVMMLQQLTGQGIWGALVLVADTTVAAALAPYAGTVADRLDRRQLIIAADLCGAATVLMLLTVRSAQAAWIAVVLVGAVAAVKSFGLPAFQAALPNLVDPDDLPTASILAGGIWGAMLGIGASLGGIVAGTFGYGFCFVLAAVCLVLAALLTTRVRRPYQLDRLTRPPTPLRDLRESLRYIKGDHTVSALLSVKPGVGLGNGVLVLFPLLAAQVFHVGAVGVGLFYAARGFGVFVGPLLLRRALRLKRVHLLDSLPVMIGTYGVAYIAFSTVDWYPLGLALVVLAHTAGGANWVLSSYTLQRRVPDRLRGRVLSTDFTLVTTAVAVSQLTVGLLVDTLSLRTLTVLNGAVALSYALVWAAVTRQARRAYRVAEVE